jgi:phage-related protein
MLRVVFYRTTAGNEPVREWLQGLAPEDRRTIGVDLWEVQEGWPLGMPLCRPLGDGLWEVRSNLQGNRIARLVFFLKRDRICVVNGFIKKTRERRRKRLS